MARETREIVVFVASPSDLPEEREAVRRAAQGVNDALGKIFGVRLEVQGWEAVQPSLGRPQDLINPLVDECDIFVGLLNRRWGSPTGTHSSGFLEEFERIVARAEGDVRGPTVALYFASIPSDLIADPGPQLKRVLAFQRKIKNEHAAMYKEFAGVDDLERAIQIFFTNILASQVEPSIKPPESTTSRGGGVEPVEAEVEEELGEARAQLGANLNAWANLLLGRPSSLGLDVDRLLLFALAMSHDQQTLGTHHANRLYRSRAALALSMGESDLWLRSLCNDAGRASQTGWGLLIPGWYFFRDRQYRGDRVAAVALSGNAGANSGALAILRRTRARPSRLWGPTGDCSSRSGDKQQRGDEADRISTAEDSSAPSTIEQAAANWKVLLGTEETRAVALTYLYEAATEDDGPLLDALLGAPTDDAAAAELVAVIAALRGDATQTVQLALPQSYRLPEWVTGVLLGSMATVSSEDLVRLVLNDLGNDDVRCAAFKHLVLADVEHEECVLLILAMLQGSQPMRRAVLDRLEREAGELVQLVDEAWNRMPSAGRQSDLEHELTAARESTDALMDRLTPNWSGLDAWIALSFRPQVQLGEFAREVLRNGGSFFDDTEGLAQAADEEAIARLREFVTGRARRAAAKILAALPANARKASDVQLIRAELANPNWVSNRQALLSLADLAESGDADALVKGARSEYLSAAELEVVLHAACRCGGRDTALKLIDSGKEDHAAIGATFLIGSESATDEELIDLLYHRAEPVRRHALMGLIHRLDPSRLVQLLDDYPARPGTHYYNVMAELDRHLYEV